MYTLPRAPPRYGGMHLGDITFLVLHPPWIYIGVSKTRYSADWNLAGLLQIAADQISFLITEELEAPRSSVLARFPAPSWSKWRLWFIPKITRKLILKIRIYALNLGNKGKFSLLVSLLWWSLVTLSCCV